MKIYADLPEVVKAAIEENIGQVEAGISLDNITLPTKLGTLLDYISKNVHSAFTLAGINFNLALKKAGDLDLTEKEAAILQFLKASSGKISKDLILKEVWGYASDADTKTVETHIYRLRQKLAALTSEEVIITNNSNYSLACH